MLKILISFIIGFLLGKFFDKIYRYLILNYFKIKLKEKNYKNLFDFDNIDDEFWFK